VTPEWGRATTQKLWPKANAQLAGESFGFACDVTQYDALTNGEGAAFVYFGEDMPAAPTPEPTFIVGLAAGVACLAILARRRGRWGRA
jgi:hypothetical protein